MFAARRCGSWPRCRFSAAIVSCVGMNGTWNSGSTCSAQLKKNASLLSSRWLRTRSMPLRTWCATPGGIADDDAIARCDAVAERELEKPVDLLEVRSRARGSREDQRIRQTRVRRMQQDAEQIEDFLGRADAARKYDDRMRDAHERFEALLDVRHDHEIVDDRVRRFRRDDAGLGDARCSDSSCAAASRARSSHPSSDLSSRPGPQPVQMSNARRPSS